MVNVARLFIETPRIHELDIRRMFDDHRHQTLFRFIRIIYICVMLHLLYEYLVYTIYTWRELREV